MEGQRHLWYCGGAPTLQCLGRSAERNVLGIMQIALLGYEVSREHVTVTC